MRVGDPGAGGVGDRGLVVGDDAATGEDVAGGFDAGGEDVARGVAGEVASVADGQHGDADGDGHFHGYGHGHGHSVGSQRAAAE